MQFPKNRLLKPFEAWVTDLKGNLFKLARVRLTFYYLVVTIVIVAIFSVIFYLSAAQNLQDDFESDATIQNTQALIIRTHSRLQTAITIADTVVLVAAAGLSYLLAGKTLRPIKEALESQKRFSADASHELRTPLAIMKSEIEVNLRNTKAEVVDYQNMATSNLEEIDRMSNVVENLLSLSRNQSATFKQDRSPLELLGLTKNVVDKMQYLADQSNITITLAKSTEAIIIGDKLALERMCMNLIQNAIQYTPRGGRITVTVQAHAEQVEVRITDTGVGIPEQDLPRIFEPFYKADAARASNGSGAGLGLSIVKAIADKHGAVIQARSTVGTGTTLSVMFPTNKKNLDV